MQRLLKTYFIDKNYNLENQLEISKKNQLNLGDYNDKISNIAIV
jgi:hypothetical protein